MQKTFDEKIASVEEKFAKGFGMLLAKAGDVDEMMTKLANIEVSKTSHV